MWSKCSKYGLSYSLSSLIICLSCNLVSATDDIIAEGKLNCNSYLVISGESNVNEFELIWTSGGYNSFKGEAFSSIDSLYFTYSIPVKDFKANNFIMYDDFIQLMKAEEYPRIILKISQEQLNILKTGGFYKNPEISITIAGVTKLFNIPCSVLYCRENTLMINGMKRINLRDFEMTPPVKLQGLVKVREEINVNFGIIFTFTDPNQKIVSR